MLNPKLTAVRKQSAVQRYLGKEQEAAAPGPETAPQPPLERQCYCILRGRFETLPSLRLVNRQGRVRSFDYSGITGANMDSPTELVVHYEGRECYTLTISGLDLDKELLDGFDDKRVLWVRELDELVAAAARKDDPDEAVVTAIRIVKGMASREW
jgi:hypothetical protein